MSERCERELQEWYNNRKPRLEYLDLADSKPSLANLYHNQSVIYDRLSLGTVLHTKKFHLLLEQQSDLENKISLQHKETQKELKLLRHRLEKHEPLTISQVKALVEEIAAQPKIVEKEALKLTSELTKHVEELKAQTHQIQQVLHDVKKFIS